MDVIITGGHKKHRLFIKEMFDNIIDEREQGNLKPILKQFDLKDGFWRIIKYYHVAEKYQYHIKFYEHMIHWNYDSDIKQIVDINFGSQDKYPESVKVKDE